MPTVQYWGGNLDQMTYWIIHIAILGLLHFLSFRKLKSDLPGSIFLAGLTLKLMAGITLGYIYYEYYGTGDTIAFFETAKNARLSNLENQPRTQFFIYLLQPLIQSTGGSYWLTSLWLTSISFISCWFAIITITKLYPKLKKLIVICFLFIPSIIFWSSGILKDTLAFAALMVLVALMLKFYRLYRVSILEILIGLLSSFIVMQLKHFLFITFLIFGGILGASTLLRKLNGKIRWVISALVLVLALASTQFIHPYLEIDRIPRTLYENNQAILQRSASEAQLNITIDNASWRAVISQIPVALHAGLFRPSIYDETPVWGWIHRIENLLLSILIAMSLLLYFKIKPEIDWTLFFGSAICILILATMLPLSAPNFGTLVRYKNAYMPYLFLINGILPFKYFASKSVD